MTDLDPLQRLSTEGVRCRQQRHGDNRRSRPKPDTAVKLCAGWYDRYVRDQLNSAAEHLRCR